MIPPGFFDNLIPKPAKWFLLALGALLLILVGLRAASCVGTHQVAAHVQQADQHHEVAVTSAAQGVIHDQEAQAQAPQIQSDASEVARLRAEVARLRHPVPAPPSASDVPEAQPLAPPVDLTAVVAKQDLLIAAQDKQIQDQAGQIKTLSLARDSWRLSAQESAAEVLQLRSALAAQQGVAKSQRWLGRFEGFAVGLGTGYVAGRIR